MATIPEALAVALQHHQAGRLREAEALYRQILQVVPQHPDALHLLGVLAHHVGNHDQAVQYIGQAIAQDSHRAEFHNNIGEAYRVWGKPAVAMGHYRQALALNPTYSDAYCNLGVVLQEQGKLEDAIAHYRRALECQPSSVQAHVNLAFGLRAQGRTLDALKIIVEALASQPTNARFRRSLAEVLRGVTLRTAGERECAALLSLCGDDNISMMDIATAIIGLLKNTPAFPLLAHAAQAGDDPFAMARSEIDAFMRDPLLMAALPRLTIWDTELEQVLTHIRRCMLFRFKENGGLVSGKHIILHGFACALARQCFSSDYAFFVAEDEAQRTDALHAGLRRALQQPSIVPRTIEWSLILAALYGPLHLLTHWERLFQPPLDHWSEPFRLVLQEHLLNRQREREFALRLTAITPIRDEVSQAVRRQYEENPYPRWTSIRCPQAAPVEAWICGLRPGEAVRRFPRPVSILVAGCGTGHHPIQTARTFCDCEVLAVDLSRTSLAYAVRMAEHFGVTNITFRQADILELGTLNRQFAVIECVGVLHHLREPLDGWHVLVGLLDQNGLLKIGLYSQKARRGIGTARDYVRTQGFSSTPDGIRKCRRAIMNLPDRDGTKSALTFGDFYSLNSCRDLLMHVQEHTFTLPGIGEYLEKLGLRFLGIECDGPTMERFRTMFPGTDARTNLALWNCFEEVYPDTFKNMYQFWCCRK